MAIQTKTVQFAFPPIASVTNNTLTNFTQISVFLPETSKTFRSVVARLSCDDIITATGGSVSTKTLSLRLGAAAYTSVANANALTNSGENLSLFMVQDFTSHFTTNWTGTSMTCDFQVTLTQATGTTLNMVNVCVTLEITYDYEDTSATQIKTVLIPLNAPVGSLPTALTTYDTIPALDTYLPEASKTYRSTFIVVQGNENRNTATTNHTVSISVGGSVTVTTGNYVGSLASDRWFRYVMFLTSTYPSTAATQTFQLRASVASRANHLQAYLVVTYEYAEASTTSVMQSLLLPLSMQVMGGTAATDAQRGITKLWIEEPGTITLRALAFFAFWTQTGAITNLLMRVGTGSYVTYTDLASVLCGGNGCMVRNDSAFTLARGENTLTFDIYRTDTTDFGWGVCGFWMVNYTSSKSAQGTGAHNKTVLRTISGNGTAAAASTGIVASVAPVPVGPTNYFLNSVGFGYELMSSGTVTPTAFLLSVERLSGEPGGASWINVVNPLHTDVEVGVYYSFNELNVFRKYPQDPTPDRLDFETARRWRWALGSVVTGWSALTVMATYHSITYSVPGTLSGGFVNPTTLTLHNESTGERLATQSVAGDGAYSFTWYDNTQNVFVHATDGTRVGRCLPGPAEGAP